MDLRYKIVATSIEDSEGTKHIHIINILSGLPLKTQSYTIRRGVTPDSLLHSPFVISSASMRACCPYLFL